MTWQPITTAPKDGTVIHLYRPKAFAWARVDTGRWDDERFAKRPKPYWCSFLNGVGILQMRDWEPTHWRPLLEAPDA